MVYRALLPWVTVQSGNEGAAPNKRRVVVLPFANINPEKSDEYFADGMTEEMIGKLSRARGLQVIARASAMRYKGKDKAAQITTSSAPPHTRQISYTHVRSRGELSFK